MEQEDKDMGTATHFFLGANSGQGFQNLFNKFSESENFYDLLVLKGGPGVGKSTMMRKIGEAMEARGENVEYLHCSGDPDSLDGVHIPGIKVAVVDGTSPHILEPNYPVASERYVNLGQFYDIALGKEKRDEIIFQIKAYKEAYRSAYHALAAARELEENLSALLLQGLDCGKLKRRTEGIIEREIRGKGSGQADRYRFLGSLTHKGAVWRFDSVQQLCPRTYHLLDSAGLAAPMLEQIHAAACAKQYGAILCPDPEHLERIQHLLIPELGVAFITVRNGMECPYDAYRRIHIDAMIDPEHLKRWKGKIKFTKKMIATLRQEGIDYLREAKREHDKLEALYHPGIDFNGLNVLVEQEIERISSY